MIGSIDASIYDNSEPSCSAFLFSFRAPYVNNSFYPHITTQDISVGIMTRLGFGEPLKVSSIAVWTKVFSETSIRFLGTTQPSIQPAAEALSLDVNQQERECKYWFKFTDYIKNYWSCTSNFPDVIAVCVWLLFALISVLQSHFFFSQLPFLSPNDKTYPYFKNTRHNDNVLCNFHYPYKYFLSYVSKM